MKENTIKFTVTKTNLNDINHGLCRSQNNSRYSGRTPVWVITIGDPANGASWASNKKWVIDDVARFFAEEYAGNPDSGSLDLAFIKSAYARRYCSFEGAWLKPCFTPEVLEESTPTEPVAEKPTPEELAAKDPNWAMPEHLSAKAKKVWRIITQFAIDHDLLYTGGCKVFYHPKLWTGEYGRQSLLVIVYEGAELAYAMDYDHAAEFRTYKWIDELAELIRPTGTYTEACTSVYSALYLA